MTMKREAKAAAITEKAARPCFRVPAASVGGYGRLLAAEAFDQRRDLQNRAGADCDINNPRKEGSFAENGGDKIKPKEADKPPIQAANDNQQQCYGI